jgi:4-amino-4-deoxy-L-arabinose transferase-like glycosyltransferase/membrane-associated phospholipid phosphatase
MHWLQTLDTRLFDFINQSLANPLFDRLMPFLSGNAFFFPLLFLLGVGLLWKGNVRMRICVLMLLVILPLGDGLIVNSLKHVVARPRPFVILPEARVFGVAGKNEVTPGTGDQAMEMAAPLRGPDADGAGGGSRRSLPSSHAANWFAAAMILFIFYRRSLRLMLPLALAVSFSRIYNGVHYPGDVLIGALVGAGYAAAGVIALQVAWNRAGSKWFPLWHQALPSLLNPNPGIPGSRLFHWAPDASPQTPHSELDQHWLYLGYLLIGVMLVGRWLYLAGGVIDLSEDEAYQWLWSKHLALSYYSKPPGIALIQFAGTTLFGDTAFGVRFVSPLFAALAGLLMLRFLAREVNARTGVWLLLIVTATPLLGIGTILMTIDPPLVLCWTWAMIAGWRAAQADGRARHWVIVGLALGLGFLCKYSAALQIACWIILFALWPAGRMHLHRPGPWLALLVFLACTLPVILWNAQHGWITVHHVAGNAGLDNRWQPTLRYFGEFSLSAMGLLNPVFFLGALWATLAFWRQRHEQPLWLYFFCMGAPLFLGYWLWSFHSRVQPNWIAPAVIPMFCLMLLYWHGRRGAKSFLAIGLALGGAAVILLYQSNFIGKISGQSLPGEMDPLRRVRAWRATAARVEAEREKLEAPGKPAFIIADHYGMTGLCTFYSPAARAALKSRPLVYCVDTAVPKNQFYFWPEYRYRDSRKGQNAIFVAELDLYRLEPGWFWKWLGHQPVSRAEPPFRPPRMLNEYVLPEFESVTDLGEFDIKIGSRTFRRLHLWACYHLK